MLRRFFGKWNTSRRRLTNEIPEQLTLLSYFPTHQISFLELFDWPAYQINSTTKTTWGLKCGKLSWCQAGTWCPDYLFQAQFNWKFAFTGSGFPSLTHWPASCKYYFQIPSNYFCLSLSLSIISLLNYQIKCWPALPRVLLGIWFYG